MQKYHHRRYSSRNNGIKSFRDLLIAFAQLWVWLVLLFLLQYIIPAYIYIIEHPIFLIPTGMLVLLFVGWVYYYKEQRKKIRMRAIREFNEIMNLSPREFEEFIEDMFRRKWFNTVIGKWTKDWWVDVTATLGDKKFIIQCKHYSENNKIWSPVIQQLNWVIVEWTESPWRIFVTTSSFTSDAVSEAEKSGMELWDKNYLIDYLKSHNLETQKVQTNRDKCDLCGGNLVLRTAHNWPHAWGQFLGCENFPNCHFIKNI
jgi:HJR/Mrr/RecB family endonuclease